ncbi:MAG: DUF4136 domain-containing protein [Acidobacteriota bacterium]
MKRLPVCCHNRVAHHCYDGCKNRHRFTACLPLLTIHSACFQSSNFTKGITMKARVVALSLCAFFLVGGVVADLSTSIHETSHASVISPQTRAVSAAEVLREAHVLYVQCESAWFNRESFERELLKRKEFDELGLALTRDEKKADLIIKINRKIFTTRFTFSLVDTQTNRVVASDRASSLGGEIEPDLAKLLLKKFQAARQQTPPAK